MDIAVVSEQVTVPILFDAKKAGLRNVEQTEKAKIIKYADVGFGASAVFFPIVGSTCGAWGEQAISGFKLIADYLSTRDLTSRTKELKDLRVFMSTLIMKRVADDIKQVLMQGEI